MRNFLGLALAVLFLCGTLGAVSDARLLRFPNINGDLVVFVYAGDVWSVPAAGGDARRLTSHPGLELFPKISPDGRWIAFSGEYSGSRQVYVMPAAGGTPRQLTYYNDVGIMPPRGGYDYVVMDWTPDSRQVLVRCNRTPWGERMGRFFLVGLDGGLETPLAIPESGGGTFSPDAGKIVYTPIEREFRTWKRYQGGRAQDIWIYDLAQNTSRRLTDFPGTDQHPSWWGDKVYFVSDRDLTLNVYSFDLASDKVEQVTHHKDYDVLWPSGRNGQLVYENGGRLVQARPGLGARAAARRQPQLRQPQRPALFQARRRVHLQLRHLPQRQAGGVRRPRRHLHRPRKGGADLQPDRRARACARSFPPGRPTAARSPTTPTPPASTRSTSWKATAAAARGR